MNPAYLAVFIVLFFFFSTGCSPQLGDACTSALDCPSGAECDRTVPDGYCLISYCEDNDDCPDEGVCIVFNPYERYCLLGCDKDSDCRDGQVCRKDLNERFCFVPIPEGEPPYDEQSHSTEE